MTFRVGVLALQGGFKEHLAAIERIKRKQRLITKTTIAGVPVRTEKELALCDALILPGGESTTIARALEFSDGLEFTPANGLDDVCARRRVLLPLRGKTESGDRHGL